MRGIKGYMGKLIIERDDIATVGTYPETRTRYRTVVNLDYGRGEFSLNLSPAAVRYLANELRAQEAELVREGALEEVGS
jgi:hypothetical protein